MDQDDFKYSSREDSSIVRYDSRDGIRELDIGDGKLLYLSSRSFRDLANNDLEGLSGEIEERIGKSEIDSKELEKIHHVLKRAMKNNPEILEE